MVGHVHIITRVGEEFHENYMLNYLGRCWHQMGIKVTTGPVDSLDADLGFLHINTTRVPASYLPANPMGRPIINTQILDISKRRISKYILSPESKYRGKVIIKTDANYFGMPDSSQLPSRLLRELRQKLASKLPWHWMQELPRKNYPILDSIAMVPGWVWQRDDLVVERFLPEIENGEYVLRMWIFLGDKEYGAKLYSHYPIVKTGNMNRYEYLHKVPESLRAERARLQMDYGKFDYVMVNGEAVLLDANTTPVISSSRSAKQSTNLSNLALGLYAFESDWT